MKKNLLSLLTAVVLGTQFSSTLMAADAPKKLLVVSVTMGYRHSSIPTGEKVLLQLAKESGAFTVEFVQQPDGKPDAPKKPAALAADATPEQQAAFKAADEKFQTAQAAQEKWMVAAKQALEKLSPENLKNYDGVIFCNTTLDLPLPDKQAFVDWVKSGKAFIGIHAASDTFHDWMPYVEMLGGEFKTHGPQVGVDCLNEDVESAATKHLGKVWSLTQEEIYQFKNYDASKVHELLVLDKHPNNKSPGHYPVSWQKESGKGRVFYTSIGHREDIWDTDPNIADRKNSVEIAKAYQAHLLGGIKWALGLEK